MVVILSIFYLNDASVFLLCLIGCFGVTPPPPPPPPPIPTPTNLSILSWYQPIHVLSYLTSLTKLLASFRRTSGAILGTRSLYSPINHKMLARAMGTAILSTMRAMWQMMPLCSLGCNTTISAVSVNTTTQRDDHCHTYNFSCQCQHNHPA